jgi:hypothetical protein
MLLMLTPVILGSGLGFPMTHEFYGHSFELEFYDCCKLLALWKNIQHNQVFINRS